MARHDEIESAIREALRHIVALKVDTVAEPGGGNLDSGPSQHRRRNVHPRHLPAALRQPDCVTTIGTPQIERSAWGRVAATSVTTALACPLHGWLCAR